ncbi:MAG: Hint domain-containing protein [Pseudoruegeria sp.]
MSLEATATQEAAPQDWEGVQILSFGRPATVHKVYLSNMSVQDKANEIRLFDQQGEDIGRISVLAPYSNGPVTVDVNTAEIGRMEISLAEGVSVLDIEYSQKKPEVRSEPTVVAPEYFVGMNENEAFGQAEKSFELSNSQLPTSAVVRCDGSGEAVVQYRNSEGKGCGTMDSKKSESVTVCFTPGTMIATPRGERPVEQLKAGDKIITRDNGIQEIRWIGGRPLSWNDLAASPFLQPILVKAGSLGNGLPERDMHLSPNHRILVSNDKTALYFDEREVLIAAKHMVNGDTIKQVESAGTAYIHFMFDHHEVVLSNGSWTESFQPGDSSLKGMGNAQREEIYGLFPELQTQEGMVAYQSARKTLKAQEARMIAH